MGGFTSRTPLVLGSWCLCLFRSASSSEGGGDSSGRNLLTEEPDSRPLLEVISDQFIDLEEVLEEVVLEELCFDPCCFDVLPDFTHFGHSHELGNSLLIKPNTKKKIKTSINQWNSQPLL